MTELSSLITKLAADWSADEWRDVTVLVAVSGGADSVALLRGLHALRAAGEGRLIVAHFNHGLRGAESDGDEAFVRELAEELGLHVVAGRREEETEARREREKSEASLRDARYRFLAQAADEAGARYVATAHTADDQVETVLHNVLRGTGLAGLGGIPRARTLSAAATLIRPLLAATRAEVLEYLAALGKGYREDASNEATTYTRNRIRRELLPLLQRDYNPRVREALLRLSAIAAEADAWFEHEAAELSGYYVRPIGAGVQIDVAALSSGPELLTKAILMDLWHRQHWPLADMNYEKWDQLVALVHGPAANRTAILRKDFPGNIRAEKQGGVLRLTRPA